MRHDTETSLTGVRNRRLGVEPCWRTLDAYVWEEIDARGLRPYVRDASYHWVGVLQANVLGFGFRGQDAEAILTDVFTSVIHTPGSLWGFDPQHASRTTLEQRYNALIYSKLCNILRDRKRAERRCGAIRSLLGDWGEEQIPDVSPGPAPLNAPDGATDPYYWRERFRRYLAGQRYGDDLVAWLDAQCGDQADQDCLLRLWGPERTLQRGGDVQFFFDRFCQVYPGLKERATVVRSASPRETRPHPPALPPRACPHAFWGSDAVRIVGERRAERMTCVELADGRRDWVETSSLVFPDAP